MADQSDGVHYSYFGVTDHVTHSTILCKAHEFEKHVLHRSLCSFALASDELEAATELMSSCDDDEEGEVDEESESGPNAKRARLG